jgi:tetratricopeptide (TPR) repeat protein
MVRIGWRQAKPSVITLADQARDAGQWHLAAAHYQKALRRNPRNPPIWVQYGHVLREAGRLVEAEAAYRMALAYDPRSADSYLHLGATLKLQGKRAQAEAAYLRALAFTPSLNGLSLELSQLGWSKAHISQLQEIIRMMRSTGTRFNDPSATG